MRVRLSAVALAAVVCVAASVAHADLGWTLKRYEDTYGPGQKSFGKVPEVGFNVAGSHLVVELSGDRSVAEAWVLGPVRDKVPKSVLEAGEAAVRGPVIQRVAFKARDAISAEIHEATFDGLVVRADVRNHLLKRVIFCGRVPTCGWLQRLFGRCPAPGPRQCEILNRMLVVDRHIDEFQVRAEAAFDKAVERMER